ncbi:MAG: MBL fold metallo-hydrolase [Candidatus Omnitrophota bacterium]|nr:MBL fold metallo-hydrolase [Candidatus Omnitrophota bacterium]
MNTNHIGYEVDFLPVGEGEKSGDAIALRFGNLLADPPQQTVFVIDGGFQDSGKTLVSHIQKYYKTDHVDVVISTHPDNDHASGLEVVLNEMKVAHLMMHQPWNHTDDISHLFEDSRVTDESVKKALRESLETVRTLETIAKQKGIKIVEPFWGVHGYNKVMRVLGPSEDFYKQLLPGYRGTPEPKQGLSPLAQFMKEAKETVKKIAESWGFETLDDSGETSAENNSSAILLFTIGDHSMLFTGDAGIPAFTEAVSRLQQEGFDFSKLNFVQVPHHGSQRNIGPTLLNVLIGNKLSSENKLKTAFVSVSPDGAPKHPAKKVTNAFLRRGAPVHATAGQTKCQRNNAPDRGWTTSTPLPFYSEVEE